MSTHGNPEARRRGGSRLDVVPPADVALLTDARYDAVQAEPDDWYFSNILEEDRLVAAALSDQGLSSVRVDWARSDVDWSQFRCAVLRTTWDYFERFDEFSSWLQRAERQTRIFNPPALLRWNMDKHYLADLQRRGVRVVPTRYLEQGQDVRLIDVLDETGWSKAVLKPCVSGAARETYRVERQDAERHQTTLQRLLAAESMMLQPFQRDIVERGEVTLVLGGDRISHALLKSAKPGDFRVQDDFGGSHRPYQPEPEALELARVALEACSPRPLYGRVDMVRDNEGRYAVMELELVEPELWYRQHPPAAAGFAGALAARLAAPA